MQTLPPLELQLKSWQSVDPTLRTIALIVSASGAALAEEARRAASSLATDLLVETSASDRETLYLFRRLATTVDGLWLLPDNDALSPPVLRELLGYALVARHRRADVQRSAARARRAADARQPCPPTSRRRCAASSSASSPAARRSCQPMTPLSAAELAVNVERRRDARSAAGRRAALGGS